MSIDFLQDDAEQIVFKVSSNKCSVSLTDLNESVEDYREGLEPEFKYKTDFTIKAFTADFNGEKVMDVGFIEGVYFEAESLFADEISFEMLCDAISSDALGMADAVTDKKGSIKPSICHHEHNLMYVEKLFVEAPYRGHGVGRYLLDNMLPFLWHALCLRPHAVIVLPYPQKKSGGGSLLDAADADADLPRLIRFYEKAGYTKLDGCDFMFKKHTSALDELLAQMGE